MNLPTVSSATAATFLLKGGVGVLPTDTVYGIVARAEDSAAVTHLYALKDRHQKPGTVVAANTTQLENLGVDTNYLKRVEKWWPGPLSVVVPMTTNTYLHQGIGSIAVRVVADNELRKMLEETGPLLTSSANHPGKPGSVTVEEAQSYFHSAVDFYVDGGDLSDRAASTIVRINEGGGVEVLRQGAIRL